MDPDAANRIHCKSQVARTRQTAAGQNRMAGSMNPDTTFRFHCKLQVAMTLPEIDPDPPRQLGTDFARRGPWGAHFARSGNNNKTTKGTDGDLTRRWAHGPANFVHLFWLKLPCSATANRRSCRLRWPAPKAAVPPAVSSRRQGSAPLRGRCPTVAPQLESAAIAKRDDGFHQGGSSGVESQTFCCEALRRAGDGSAIVPQRVK